MDPTNKLIVIAFRGSQSIQNFIADLVALQEPWSVCSGCWAHIGFLDSWNSVKSQVTNAVNSAQSANPGYQIIATGHSLGAAMATLAAGELRSEGYSVALVCMATSSSSPSIFSRSLTNIQPQQYTYGSPMVGNTALAEFITAQPGGNFRVTHANDLVPKLPGYELGYAHVSPEYWITSAIDVTVTTSVVQVSTGNEDTSGNEGQSGGSIPDHLFYFNSISACGPVGINE